MKGSERHKLKGNDLSLALAEASARLGEHGRQYGLVAGIVALILVAGLGYWGWRSRADSRAQAMLGEAMNVTQAPVEAANPATTPAAGQPQSYPTVQARGEAALAKFMDVANSYPSSEAGIAARYYAAALLGMLGRPAEAVTRYQEVISHAGANSFYGRMAQLGVIDAQAQAKQYDQAIAASQALVNTTTNDASMPRDAVLMQLGRLYAAAGKKAEAKQTLDKVLAEFPDSVYAAEAKQLLSALT